MSLIVNRQMKCLIDVTFFFYGLKFWCSNQAFSSPYDRFSQFQLRFKEQWNLEVENMNVKYMITAISV